MTSLTRRKWQHWATQWLQIAVVLCSVGSFVEGRLLESQSNSSLRTTSTTSESTSQPRDPPSTNTTTTPDTTSDTTMMVESANVQQSPRIDDNNFRTLVRHCLKSHNSNACDVMAHWDISRVTDCSLLMWEPTNDANDDWILLKGARTFDVDLSRWNTSSCTTMHGM